MKKLILMLVVLMGLIGEISAAPKVSGTFEIIIARPKNNCTSGLWICKKILDIKISWESRAVKTEVQDNGDGTLTLTFLTKLPETGTEFYADSDETSTLPDEIAKRMGYSVVHLIPGRYKLSPPSNGNYGSVTIRFRTN